MRLARPRVTIGRIMILVAIVGMALCGSVLAVRLKRRAEHYRQTATMLASFETFYRQSIILTTQSLASARDSRKAQTEMMREADRIHPGADALIEQMKSALGINDNWAEDLEESLELERARLSYFSLMREKYERAASRPWERVAPDPPLPVRHPKATPVAPDQPDPPKPSPSARVHHRVFTMLPRVESAPSDGIELAPRRTAPPRRGRRQYESPPITSPALRVASA